MKINYRIKKLNSYLFLLHGIDAVFMFYISTDILCGNARYQTGRRLGQGRRLFCVQETKLTAYNFLFLSTNFHEHDLG